MPGTSFKEELILADTLSCGQYSDNTVLFSVEGPFFRKALLCVGSPGYKPATGERWLGESAIGYLGGLGSDPPSYVGKILDRGVKVFANKFPDVTLSRAPIPRYVTWDALPSPDLQLERTESPEDCIPTLSAIVELAFEVEEDELGLVRPSYHATKHCLRLLISLATRGSFLTPTDIGGDRNGAIRVTWSIGHRETELICPSEDGEAPYIYFSTEADYGTEQATVENLERRVRWATDGD